MWFSRTRHAAFIELINAHLMGSSGWQRRVYGENHFTNQLIQQHLHCSAVASVILTVIYLYYQTFKFFAT